MSADPFQKLVDRVDSGEIAFAHALELARRDLAPKLTRQIVEDALEVTGAFVDNRRYQQALPRLQVIAAALEEWDSPDAAAFLFHTRADTVNVAAGSLIDIADASVYQMALKSGEELLADAEKRGHPGHVAMMNRMLGVLHLDPYIVNHTSSDYGAAHQRWLLTAAKKKGATAAFDQKGELPEPVAALEKAAGYLRAAVDGTQGHLRGMNLKALAEAEVFRRVAAEEEEFVTSAIVAIAREALEYLDPKKDPDAVASARRIIQAGGETVETELDSESVGALFARDPARALMVILAKAQSLEPLEAVQWLIEGRPLFDAAGGEGERMQRWQLMLQFCYDILKRTAGDAAGKPFAQAHQILRKKVEENELRAWSLIGYAAHSGSWNGEAEGLHAVREAVELLQKRREEVDDLLTFADAVLTLGLGSNAVSSGNWADAIVNYAAAARLHIVLGQPRAARDLLERILDVTERGFDDHNVPGAALGHLAPLALSIEALDDAGASLTLRKIVKRIVTAMTAKGKLLVEWLNGAMLLAKGARLARLLASKTRGESAELAPLLEAIAIAEEEARDDASPDTDAFFDELVLLSYASSTERESGDTPRERARNLQRAFDQRYNEYLLRRAGVDPVLFPIDSVREHLAADAVLVNYYLGAAPSGNVGVYAAMFTREGQWLSMIDAAFPDATISLGSPSGDGETLAHPLSFTVNSLREKIQQDPEDGAALTAEGAKELQDYLPLFFGHLLPVLDELYAKGKRVLYVVPHGPFHFVPFHLLGGESPLADRWTVIAVPNLALVTQARAKNRARGSVAAIGMSFEGQNQWNLAPMTEAADEARAIAKIFGAAPLIDADATREAVFSAMGDARYVHVSSHGVHNVAAPSFQTVFLAADDTSDGRLFAHEVSALDLSHVELVTLSACETALGRFDEADNLRGLPASFFLAGAGALVGTLWPAEVLSSRYFFTALYSALAGGASIVDAFRTAQQATRKEHPQYRDWGAFYLMRSPVESVVRPLGDA